MTITDMIYFFILLNIKVLSKKGEEQSYSKETIDANMAYLAPVVAARLALYVLALVFSGLFTFGSGWLWRSVSFGLDTCLALCLMMLFK
jgi:hypothetical protein